MNVLIGYMIDGRNSGVDKYILQVLCVLKERGICADILTMKDNDALRASLAPYQADVLEIPSLMHPVQQYRALQKLLAAKNYDVAYFNISEPMNCIGAKAAHVAGVRRVVIHSHSSGQGGNGEIKDRVKMILNRMARPQIKKYGDLFLACSKTAGEWLFSEKVRNAPSFRILYNPIDVAAYAYSPSVRREMRKALGLEDACVIGHIGNFQPVKNSGFLLNILEETRKLIPHVVLLSMGDGPEQKNVQKMAENRGLAEYVRFLGIRDDVAKVLQAVDFFALPSLFEGLPISAIEAQAAGLKTILSDRISREVQISEDCMFRSIKDDGSQWAKTIAENWPYERRDFSSRYTLIERFDIAAQKDKIRSIFEDT